MFHHDSSPVMFTFSFSLSFDMIYAPSCPSFGPNCRLVFLVSASLFVRVPLQLCLSLSLSLSPALALCGCVCACVCWPVGLVCMPFWSVCCLWVLLVFRSGLLLWSVLSPRSSESDWLPGSWIATPNHSKWLRRCGIFPFLNSVHWWGNKALWSALHVAAASVRLTVSTKLSHLSRDHRPIVLRLCQLCETSKKEGLWPEHQASPGIANFFEPPRLLSHS